MLNFWYWCWKALLGILHYAYACMVRDIFFYCFKNKRSHYYAQSRSQWNALMLPTLHFVTQGIILFSKSLCVSLTHMYNGGSGTGVLGHPTARKARRRVLPEPRSQNAPLYMFLSLPRPVPQLFFILKKYICLCRKQWLLQIFREMFLKCFMARSRRIKDWPPPISPTVIGEFEIVRNNFDQWLRVWKMRATKNNKDLFKFFQKTKNSFINVCKNEVEALKSIKIQFSLLVKFHMTREGKVEEMEHYFNRMQPVIVNEHNMDTLNPLLNQFTDEVKGEIEAWSERGSGWIMDKILKAFINVAQYQPMRGGSYMELPTKPEKQESNNKCEKQRQSMFEMGA